MQGLQEGLTYAFMVEAIVKISALGLQEYLRDSFNVFDLSLVMISGLEFYLNR